MPIVAAVFVSPGFLDMGRLRVWARQTLHENVVLITDDPTDANSVLGRALRCEGVVHAVFRTPTTLRSAADLIAARRARDMAMIGIASHVVLFGYVTQGEHFDGKSVIQY